MTRTYRDRWDLRLKRPNSHSENDQQQYALQRLDSTHDRLVTETTNLFTVYKPTDDYFVDSLTAEKGWLTTRKNDLQRLICLKFDLKVDSGKRLNYWLEFDLEKRLNCWLKFDSKKRLNYWLTFDSEKRLNDFYDLTLT